MSLRGTLGSALKRVRGRRRFVDAPDSRIDEAARRPSVVRQPDVDHGLPSVMLRRVMRISLSSCWCAAAGPCPSPGPRRAPRFHAQRHLQRQPEGFPVPAEARGHHPPARPHRGRARPANERGRRGKGFYEQAMGRLYGNHAMQLGNASTSSANSTRTSKRCCV